MAFHFDFQIGSRDPGSAARTAVFHTPHGAIRTPVFAPVGTQATVKALTPHELESLDADLILANAYHLYLRPGAERIARLGGLHRFMGWSRPILTDSGGFQVFSLANSRRVDDEGVTFRSHIDGSEHRFTPELVMAIEENLGADIIMCLDECADPLDRAYLDDAVRRTHLWAERCRAAQRRSDQALFGIVQGGIFADMRRVSARFLRGLDFVGYAIGGLSVGETKAQTYDALDATVPELPDDRPRYLMGVGAPEDILESVVRGVDIFDCVLPTRLARNGGLLTHRGRLNIRNAQFTEEVGPIEPECACYTCQHFSLAYLRHLFQAQEILGLRLATVHNLHFMLRFMEEVRSAIAAGAFTRFRSEFVSAYRLSDQEARLAGHAARRAAGAPKRAEQ